MAEIEFPLDFVEKTTPVDDDMIFIADSEDDDNGKKIKYLNLKGEKGDAVVFRGAYNGATAYAVNDIVSYTNGIAYLCILASTGNVPTNATYWGALFTPVAATNVIQGVGYAALAAQVAAGTASSGGIYYFVTPDLLKTTNDNLDVEKLKIKDKVDVRFATSSNITISSPGSSFDGGTAASLDRILLFGQSAPAENGIWIWNGAASPMTRATDFDTNVNNEVDLGAEVWVQAGTVNTGKRFALTTTGSITVGTTALTFTQTYPPNPSADNTYSTASNTQILSAATSRNTTSTRDVLVKEFTVYCNGGTRVGYDLNNSAGGTPSIATVTVNDAQIGTSSHTGISVASYTTDFNFKGWAKVSIYYRSFSGANTFTLSNSFIGYTGVTGAVQAVNTN